MPHNHINKMYRRTITTRPDNDKEEVRNEVADYTDTGRTVSEICVCFDTDIADFTHSQVAADGRRNPDDEKFIAQIKWHGNCFRI